MWLIDGKSKVSKSLGTLPLNYLIVFFNKLSSSRVFGKTNFCLRWLTYSIVLGITTRLELDTRKQLSGRMFFLNREEESNMDLSLTLTREQQHCHTELVYLIVSK